MKIRKQEYLKLVQELSPKSHLWKDVGNAFWVGGLICTLGQVLLTFYRWLGLAEDLAFGAVSMTLVFLSAILTGLAVYDDIAKIGGAGTLVPITGFSNAVVSAAVEFQTEGFITGVGTKMFTIAGPVILYGTSASVVYGVIYWIMTR